MLCLTDIRYIVNSLPWKRIIDYNGRFYEIAPSSIQLLDETSAITVNDRVSIQLIDNVAILENRHIRAQIDCFGRIQSFKLVSNSHFDYVAANEYLNQLIIYDDVPLYWYVHFVNDICFKNI